MNRLFVIALLLVAGCRVGAMLDEHVERNASELYEIQKQRLAELAPAYDTERLIALRSLSKDNSVSADIIQRASAIADKTAAGVAYQKQATAVEIAEYKLADASQRLGPPFGRTAKEMELARQTDEDERLISALKAVADK
jgi:hypothetical protein